MEACILSLLRGGGGGGGVLEHPEHPPPVSAPDNIKVYRFNFWMSGTCNFDDHFQ